MTAVDSYCLKSGTPAGLANAEKLLLIESFWETFASYWAENDKDHKLRGFNAMEKCVPLIVAVYNDKCSKDINGVIKDSAAEPYNDCRPVTANSGVEKQLYTSCFSFTGNVRTNFVTLEDNTKKLFVEVLKTCEGAQNCYVAHLRKSLIPGDELMGMRKKLRKFLGDNKCDEWEAALFPAGN
jgi:hypothetical protein